MPADYYALLGVGRDASEDEIKRAYRQLARELHPDANGGDPVAAERFKEVAAAYETLRDPERRRRYDLFGPDGAARAGAQGGNPGDVFATGFSDLFDSFFSGGGFARTGRAGPSRGSDVEVAIELTFEEAVFGATKEFTVRMAATCTACQGSGARAGTTPTTCETCGGSGELRRVRQSVLGQMVTASPCPTCRGTGRMIANPCPECRGEGRRNEERAISVDVPAGVDDGSTLRLTARGEAGPRGAGPGDLYVHVRVQPHQRFRRSGYDLETELDVPVTQASLGAKVVVETLDGDEELEIPPGTQTGRVFHLRGLGVPHVQARGRGDLLIQVVVETPTGLTPAQEELLRQLAAERGEELAPPEEGGFLHRIRSRLH